MTYRLLSPARGDKPETEVVMECDDFYEQLGDVVHHRVEGETRCRICGEITNYWTDSLTMFARLPDRCGDVPELP